jgi:hypothetical protein
VCVETCGTDEPDDWIAPELNEKPSSSDCTATDDDGDELVVPELVAVVPG